MSLLVLPLSPDETDLVTVAELRELLACDGVLFESAGHPLAAWLEERGTRVEVRDEESRSDRPGWALVVDPWSPRLVELALSGARVLVGPRPAPDSLTAARGAGIARRAGAAAAALAAVMARLRSVDGCPWDLEQTHESLLPHLLEEAGEVVETIERGELGPQLEEELGDVLLQVFFHAQLASDDGRFDVAGVTDRLSAKLLNRHPHVFGDVTVSGADEVVRNWAAIKAAEKAGRRGEGEARGKE